MRRLSFERFFTRLVIVFLMAPGFSYAQERVIHPNWAPTTKRLRPDDITTIMGYRAEFSGKLTHAPHPDADPKEDAAVYGFSSEDDRMTWSVEAPEDAEYKVALIYCGNEKILSECTLEVRSGSTLITEKTHVPTWEGKPYYQRHHLGKSLFLKKGLNRITLRLVDLPESQVAAANSSYLRKEPFRQRDHVVKHGFCMWSIELFRPEAYVALKERSKKMKPDLDWMIEGKYGLFVHFSPVSYASYGETPLKDQYQEMVDLFDVEAFADTVAETGASWVCFTTTHGAHYWPGPSNTLDQILPGRTCERDLIGELIRELGKHDIRLMMYYGLCRRDSAWTKAAGMHQPNSSVYIENIETFFREMSLRYGEELVSSSGYFDGAGWSAYQYDPSWEKWSMAIKAGNPNAPAGFSQTWGPRVSPFSDLQMTDGRGRKPMPAPAYMFMENGQFENLQPAFWGHIDDWIVSKPYHGKFSVTPPYSTDEYIEIFRTMDEADVPVTMNLLITSDVTRERPFFNPESVEIMRQVKKAIKVEKAPRPNVILIMADDLGWGDTGYNGHDQIKTPNLDAMAMNGAQFNRFYAAAPVCSPTRGSVLTGRNPYRYGITTANVSHLKEKEINLAEVLAAEGYLTGHFGKWHLGTLFPDFSGRGEKRKPAENHMTPGMAGFDQWCSTEASVPTYYQSDDYNYDRRELYIENGIPLKEKPSACDSKLVMDKAIPFIENATKEEKPFFTVIWFHAPHGPVVGHPEYMKSLYSDLSENQQHYYSTVTALDAQVGVLRTKLRELGIEKNTMLCFTSDNGPEGNPGKKERYQGSAGKFRGRKRSLYEGGIRVPGIIEWPAVIKDHMEIDVPAVTSDYFPTICEMLGYTFKDQRPIDGISLMKIIGGEQEKRGTSIGFQFVNHRQEAVIGDRYKLIHNTGGKRTGSDNSDLPRSEYELYDILMDPYETQNLVEKYPEIIDEMKLDLEKFVESCARSNRGEDYPQHKEK